jgi:hypothetical protein
MLPQSELAVLGHCSRLNLMRSCSTNVAEFPIIFAETQLAKNKSPPPAGIRLRTISTEFFEQYGKLGVQQAGCYHHPGGRRGISTWLSRQQKRRGITLCLWFCIAHPAPASYSDPEAHLPTQLHTHLAHPAVKRELFKPREHRYYANLCVPVRPAYKYMAGHGPNQGCTQILGQANPFMLSKTAPAQPPTRTRCSWGIWRHMQGRSPGAVRSWHGQMLAQADVA